MSLDNQNQLVNSCRMTSAFTKLSADPWRWLLVLAVIAWMNAGIHGFRMPWQPLIVSDSNSGGLMRQLIFGTAGLFAISRMICTRSLGAACVRQLPWCLVAFLLLLSTSWSANMALTVKRAGIFILGLMLIIALIHSTNKPVLLMKRCVVTTIGVCAWTSIAMVFAFPAECSSIVSRPGLAGLASHPNTLGAVMFTGWIVSLGWPPSSRSEIIAVRLAQVGIGVALFWTGSITAILVALVGTMVYAILIAPPYRRGTLILLAVVFLLAAAVIGPQNLKSWFFDTVQRDETLSGRDVLWAEVYREGSKQPVFGGGFGAFWYEGRGRELTGTWNPRQAHNTYLDIFVDLGWVGLLCICGLVFGVLYCGLCEVIGRYGTPQRAAVASLIALATASLGVYGWSQSFLLRLDQIIMIVLLWSLMLLTNRDGNGIHAEFAIDSSD